MILQLTLMAAIQGAQPHGPGCERVGSDVYCPSPRTDPAADIINDAAFRKRVSDARRRLRDRDAAQTAAQQEGQQGLSEVGTLIANGDCPGALRLVLTRGDLDAAAKVKALCDQ